jgi:hypothetical protein
MSLNSETQILLGAGEYGKGTREMRMDQSEVEQKVQVDHASH